MECTDVVAFKWLCLLCNCDRHEFICFCEYLLLVKANEVDYLAVSSQRVQRSERRLNIYKPSKERVGVCEDYVIGREINSRG